MYSGPQPSQPPYYPPQPGYQPPYQPPRPRSSYKLAGIMLALCLLCGLGAMLLFARGVQGVGSAVGVADYEFTFMRNSRFSVPGSKRVTIKNVGSYKILGALDAQGNRPPNRSISVKITDPSGARVSPRTFSVNETATIDDQKFESMYQFDARKAGTYTISATGQATTLMLMRAVGAREAENIVKGAGGTIGGLFGGFALLCLSGLFGFIALISGVVTLARNS